MYALLPRIVHGSTLERLGADDLIPFTPADGRYPIAIDTDTDTQRLAFLLDTEIVAGKPGFNATQTKILRQLTDHPLATKTNATDGRLIQDYEIELRSRRGIEQNIVALAVQGLKNTIGVSADLGRDEHGVLGVYLGELAGLAVVDVYGSFISEESKKGITIANCGIEPVIRTAGGALGLLPVGAKVLPNLYLMDM